MLPTSVSQELRRTSDISTKQRASHSLPKETMTCRARVVAADIANLVGIEIMAVLHPIKHDLGQRRCLLLFSIGVESSVVHTEYQLSNVSSLLEWLGVESRTN